MSDDKSAGELRLERARRMAIEGAEAWAEHETEQKAIEASGLLISWATPAARKPTPARRSERTSWRLRS